MQFDDFFLPEGSSMMVTTSFILYKSDTPMESWYRFSYISRNLNNCKRHPGTSANKLYTLDLQVKIRNLNSKIPKWFNHYLKSAGLWACPSFLEIKILLNPIFLRCSWEMAYWASAIEDTRTQAAMLPSDWKKTDTCKTLTCSLNTPVIILFISRCSIVWSRLVTCSSTGW